MKIFDYPVALLVCSVVILWLATQAGAAIHRWRSQFEDAEREDIGVMLGASLTLTALVIGFSFSMAASRYDQRRNYEDAEANAIGTEYVRLGLLPDADAAKARRLMKQYLDQRILFYTTGDAQRLQQIDAATAQLQNDLWAAVQEPAKANPTLLDLVVLTGMNDTLNSQSYTQAAWWNRIPTGAWALMLAMGVFSNVLFGYNSRRTYHGKLRYVLMPLILAVAYFLIADVDSPRRGIIQVPPQNLISLALSLPPQ